MTFKRDFKSGDLIISVEGGRNFELFDSSPTDNIQYKYNYLPDGSILTVLGYIRDDESIVTRERYVADAIILLYNNEKYIATPWRLKKI